MTNLAQPSILDVNFHEDASCPSGLETAYGPLGLHTEGHYLQLAEQEVPKYTIGNSDEPAYTPPSPRQEEVEEIATEGRSICEIRPRNLYILLTVAVLLVVGAIAGGIVSGLNNVHTHHIQVNQQPSPAALQILTSSHIAACNHTAIGFGHSQTVYFQDPYNSLIARHFNISINKWQTYNITDILSSTTDSLNILPGTPLACASCNDWGCANTYVYFLTPDYSIRAVEDYSKEPGGWTVVTGWTMANLTTSANSKLTAAFNAHWEAYKYGSFSVAYQAPTGSLHVVNDSRFETVEQDEFSSLVTGTSLAMVPQWENSASRLLSRMSLVAEVGTSSNTGDMWVANYYDYKWTLGTLVIPGTPAGTSPAAYAIASLNGYQDTLYLALLSNGTLTGRVVGEHNMTIHSINLVGGPSTNFSAIAATQNGMLYGISNDTILKYAFDEANPSTLNYVKTIYP